MKISRAKPEDSQTERYILIALIMSENVCRELKNSYQPEFFQVKITKELAKWCFDFFNDYDTAPQREIETIYEMKSKSGKIDPDLDEEINKFLISLSHEYEEWEEFNEQYYTELGIKYFKKRSFVILSEQIKNAAEEDDVDEAERKFSDFTKVKESLDQSRDILDESGIVSLRTSLMNKPPYLFEIPGALGRMIGPIERDSFIGILGREKSGKTYHLMMFATAAAKKGLNVAMIETGDLTQDQLDLRFYSNLTNKTAKEMHTGNKYIPVMDCIYNQLCECEYSPNDDSVVVYDDHGYLKYINGLDNSDVLDGHETCIECWKDRFLRYSKFRGSAWWKEQEIDVWQWREAKQKAQKLKKRYKGRIVTEAFPMRTVRASDIRDWCIKKQKQEGFIPDVLIVDYPDILLPESKNGEYRHQENEKWMVLREISQEFHCCVIVATQADAKSYNKETLHLDNYSEDKRKYSHVTHFLAINNTPKELKNGISRMGVLLLREDSVQITQQVTLLQNLSAAKPNLASFFGRIPAM